MLIEKVIPIADMSYYASISASSVCFDIETTGLNKQYSYITVIGTGYVENKNIIFKQWLLDDPSQERSILAQFAYYLRGFKSIIQFNGNSFDIPFTAHRCRLYGLENPFWNMDLIDIYKSAKHLGHVCDFKNLKQKTLENLFDIERRDRISGSDCIFAYRRYLRYFDTDARDALLLHNEEDVLGLLKIYPIHNIIHIADEFEINGADVAENIRISFEIRRPLPFEISRKTAEYEIKIYGCRGVLTLFSIMCTRRIYFENHKDYYYLPDEDRSVHKSVGVYVEPSRRKKASRANCYENIEDRFFKQYAENIRPVFKKELKDKSFWFRKHDFEKAPAAEIYGLCRSWLKHIFRL